MAHPFLCKKCLPLNSKLVVVNMSLENSTTNSGPFNSPSFNFDGLLRASFAASMPPLVGISCREM